MWIICTNILRVTENIIIIAVFDFAYNMCKLEHACLSEAY